MYNNIVELTNNPLTSLNLSDKQTYNFHILRFNQFLNGGPISIDAVRTYIQYAKQQYKPSSLANIKAAVKYSVNKLMKGTNRISHLFAMIDNEFKLAKDQPIVNL